MLDIRKIEPELTYNIRQAVLRPLQPVEDSMYDTDHTENAFHVGAFYQARLISVATFVIDKNPNFSLKKQYRLRQMATLEEFRNLSAGSSIVKFAENIIKEHNSDLIWCKARVSAVEYYKKLGFKAYGEVFDYPPIGLHIIMYKEL
ncbi:GNAT family N-acetyltransferase [Lysinibacillus sp. G4S2]|uniref:GNAT family N-acetyltransferase n=1 Tax=Lysinibacillus sp. G4S2 TaxID=3055859 RepID=UPI0025A0EE8F|nr:GNAT family N-acetyltransferase [Lysinibacillus sp. G4S2]MDM5248214.1 GNAT family N-acetyltransferase [Lysinibacillus sp. G4S2]